MIELETGAWAALALGFLLGLKHATDADHVVAISVIAKEEASAWKVIWVGLSWSLGHTTPLFVLGIIILLLKEAVLTHYVNFAPTLELFVGFMLLFLGFQVFYNLQRGTLHLHQHEHDGQSHLHVHATHATEIEPIKISTHNFWSMSKPSFRTKSYVIGVIHGLAGSAAVMLVLLPQIESIWVGVGYLVMFGVGTCISMCAITIALSVPFALTANAKNFNTYIAFIAGLASTAFGCVIIYGYFS